MGPDWEGPAAGHRETGQTVGLQLENKGAVTVVALGMGLAVGPGTAGACVAADRVVLPGRVELKSEEDGVALGKATGHQVVQVEVVSTGFVADLDEEPGLAGHNKVPGPESHRLLVPAGHKIPSKKNIQTN